MENYSVGPGPRPGYWIFLPGLVLTALGVLILVHEELLRYMVAGLFLLLGLLLLSVAWQFRQGRLAGKIFRRFQ